MNLVIALNEGLISILLKDNLELIDKIILVEKNNLSNTLLKELDNIIKRNRVPKNQLKIIYVESDLPDSYTSARIAKSIAKSYLFSAKLK
jgi:tRNA A37 threonylcarbamoyladenosine modification protein TsaB